MDLRIGSNELCPESVAYIMRLKEKGIVSTYYQHGSNDRKYPVMREMFYDPANPIDTKWILWFDDDTVCDRDPQWLPILTRHIIEHYPKNNHMFGGKYVWTMNQDQIELFKARPWYKKRAFRAKGGKEAPNGRHIIFATGGFWALSTHAMRACNIPDPDLGHNGGDYTIGEQLWQGGFGLKAFNGKKQFVRTSSVPRRGLDETHFGMKT
ncbi:MAG: hypothetical protein IID15_00650 [Candidatus Marinimicrobia bacterium]|nr:hypothetical protein [Candidatus Neomarinimicrobiota bacterium]